MKANRGHSIPFLEEPTSRSGQPLHRRLYRRVRDGILRGGIAPGTRLPSARTLAREEGVSRNTVEAAFRQLQAEGFVERRVGAGTWVAEDLPGRLLTPRGSTGPRFREASRGEPRDTLSARGRRLAALESDPPLDTRLTFAPCLPGLEAIPFDTWSRTAARHARLLRHSSLSAAPAGVPALRQAIAAYLQLHRGVRCSADRVVILNSTQQAVSLAAHVLLDPGDRVWLEDPGYRSARRAILNAGAEVQPVPVDREGLDVATGIGRAPAARMAYVTPSHQYPTGVTLSLARRLELLEWSRTTGAWIFEDDYDGELRHRGRPLAPMQGLDEEGRVIYAGTFNKILFPSLRIAYVVLPEQLVEPFVRAKEVMDGFTSPILQGALADFIEEGHFAVHLRRVRAMYHERRERFMAVAGRGLPETVGLGPADAGMHVALDLPPEVDDVRLSERARRAGVAAPALSTYAIENSIRGLLVHYGNARPSEFDRAVGTLRELMTEPG